MDMKLKVREMCMTDEFTGAQKMRKRGVPHLKKFLAVITMMSHLHLLLGSCFNKI